VCTVVPEEVCQSSKLPVRRGAAGGLQPWTGLVPGGGGGGAHGHGQPSRSARTLTGMYWDCQDSSLHVRVFLREDVGIRIMQMLAV
jgi:hypothetical protein